ISNYNLNHIFPRTHLRAHLHDSCAEQPFRIGLIEWRERFFLTSKYQLPIAVHPELRLESWLASVLVNPGVVDIEGIDQREICFKESYCRIRVWISLKVGAFRFFGRRLNRRILAIGFERDATQENAGYRKSILAQVRNLYKLRSCTNALRSLITDGHPQLIGTSLLDRDTQAINKSILINSLKVGGGNRDAARVNKLIDDLSIITKCDRGNLKCSFARTICFGAEGKITGFDMEKRLQYRARRFTVGEERRQLQLYV